MTEDDLSKAQELFRTRKSVENSLEAARIAASSAGIVEGRLEVSRSVRQPSGEKHSVASYMRFDKEDCAAICKQATILLSERLKDIDASLRAFGLEPPKPAETVPRPHTSGDPATLPAIVGIVRAVALAPQGERNAIAYWAACRLREVVEEGKITSDLARELLLESAARCGLPLAEARRTFDSAFRTAP